MRSEHTAGSSGETHVEVEEVEELLHLTLTSLDGIGLVEDTHLSGDICAVDNGGDASGNRHRGPVGELGIGLLPPCGHRAPHVNTYEAIPDERTEEVGGVLGPHIAEAPIHQGECTCSIGRTGAGEEPPLLVLRVARRLATGLTRGEVTGSDDGAQFGGLMRLASDGLEPKAGEDGTADSLRGDSERWAVDVNDDPTRHPKRGCHNRPGGWLVQVGESKGQRQHIVEARLPNEHRCPGVRQQDRTLELIEFAQTNSNRCELSRGVAGAVEAGTTSVDDRCTRCGVGGVLATDDDGFSCLVVEGTDEDRDTPVASA